jgi:RNA polymerase sigma factor (sigma-70 family)
MTPDFELLAKFARTNVEDAFAELVRRHVNLVYSAALRQVNGDAHLAQDVAQTVFTDLARKAGSLARRESLTGWLYTSAHFAAAKIVRGEKRRRDREETFMRETIPETAPDLDWEKLQPVLDAAMHELKAGDREAILLRYFENRPFAEVGAKLGLNENAARMRVERALEKLRGTLAKRGLATATALASVISANAVQIAPATLAATLTTASIATAGTGTFTLLKIMTATKLKLAFSALVVVSAATAFVIQNQAQEKLREENGALTQQITKLQTDNQNFSNRLAEVSETKKLSDEQFNELLKLRGEVGVLQQQLESEKAQKLKETAFSKEARPVHLVPNAYISKDQITNAGFNTPEAAWQTYMNGCLSDNYDQAVGAMAGQISTQSLNNPQDRENFEKMVSKGELSNFLGQQILAKKIVSGEKVDLEVLVFQDGKAPDISIQHMVKENDQWKMAGSASVGPSWGKDGQIESVVPNQ